MPSLMGPVLCYRLGVVTWALSELYHLSWDYIMEVRVIFLKDFMLGLSIVQMPASSCPISSSTLVLAPFRAQH